MLRLLLAVYFLSLFRFMYAQVPHFTSHAFSRYGSGEINVLSQSANGYIWIGSNDGLYRYDGYSYRSFSPLDSISEFNVTALYCDSTSLLWVGCDNGNIYQLSHGVLDRWEPEESTPGKRITGLGRDQQGRLWFSTYGEGLYVTGQSHLYNFNRDDGLIDDEIYEIAFATDGKVWAATDNGVSICDFTGEVKKVENIKERDGLNDEIVFALQSDASGMWIGFESHGFCYYNLQVDSIDFRTSSWSAGSVKGFTQYGDTQMWIATRDRGVCRISFDDLENLDTIPIPGNSEINDLLIDREGNIWFATRDDLLSARIDVDVMKTEFGHIQAVLQCGSRGLWVGTQAGLFYRSDGHWEKIDWINANVISLFEDIHGQIWVGTFGQGVVIWNPKTDSRMRLSESDGLRNGSILDIDGFEERVWLATLGGIVEVYNESPISHSIHKPSFINLDESSGLTASFFYSVFADSKGRIWFGTDGDGILMMENEVFRSLLSDQTVPARTVYCFNEDQDGHIWAGTAENGVYQIMQDSFRQYHTIDGMRNLSISAIGMDSQDHILLVHSDGFDILNKSNDRIKYFGERAGADQLNPAMNAIHQPHPGLTWIGGTDKLIRHVCLEHFAGNYPAIVLDEVSVMGRSVNRALTRKFAYKENFIEFKFSGIWLTHPEEISYEYKLDNYDMVWKSTSDRQVSYSSLAAGDYQFKVRTALHGQPIEEAESSYAFTIIPPLWIRPVFLIPTALIIGAFLYWMQQYR